jgi:hypothetical protein
MASRPEVTIDSGPLPKRFVELHVTELTSWQKHRKPEKAIVLQWPLGFAGPSTLLIGFEVLGKGTSSPTIRLTLPKDGDFQVLQDYMTAIAAQDEAYRRRTTA